MRARPYGQPATGLLVAKCTAIGCNVNRVDLMEWNFVMFQIRDDEVVHCTLCVTVHPRTRNVFVTLLPVRSPVGARTKTCIALRQGALCTQSSIVVMSLSRAPVRANVEQSRMTEGWHALSGVEDVMWRVYVRTPFT